MRKVVKALYNPFIKFYFYSKLKSFIKTKKSTSYLVLDIDNTIADTWKNIENFKKNRKNFFSNLLPLVGTIQYVKEKYGHLPIIFLSNRNIIDYQVTKDWLQKNGFNTPECLLILTNDPNDKLTYLKYLTNNYAVTYFDDLTYNHENGKELYYHEVISEVKKMKIDYFDYEFILKLNSN